MSTPKKKKVRSAVKSVKPKKKVTKKVPVSGVPKVLKARGYKRKPKAVKMEPRLVFHLHIPKSAYLKIQEASLRCGLSMQEFVRRAAATAVFDMPATANF